MDAVCAAFYTHAYGGSFYPIPHELRLMAANLMQYQQRLDWLRKSGFNCVRCGHCCTSLKIDADGGELAQAEQLWRNVALEDHDDGGRRVYHTNRLHLDAPEVERIVQVTGMKWFDVARPSPPRGISREGELRSLLWLLRYRGAGERLGDCYFYDHAAEACKIYEDRPLVCRSHPFILDVDGRDVSIVMKCPYGKRGEMSSENALSYAEATLKWYRIYLKLKFKFEIATMDLDPKRTREEGGRRFRANLKKGRVVFRVMDSAGVHRVLMRVGKANKHKYSLL